MAMKRKNPRYFRVLSSLETVLLSFIPFPM
jgi:hypothetical protein